MTFAEALPPRTSPSSTSTASASSSTASATATPAPRPSSTPASRRWTRVELDAFAGKLREILWGDEDLAYRIDRALDWDDLGTKGLGDSVLLKMFAVTDPQRFLPVFPLTGPMGKLAMLRRLGLRLTREHARLAASSTSPPTTRCAGCSSRCSRATPGDRASSPTGCSTTTMTPRGPRMRIASHGRQRPAGPGGVPAGARGAA